MGRGSTMRTQLELRASQVDPLDGLREGSGRIREAIAEATASLGRMAALMQGEAERMRQRAGVTRDEQHEARRMVMRAEVFTRTMTEVTMHAVELGEPYIEPGGIDDYRRCLDVLERILAEQERFKGVAAAAYERSLASLTPGQEQRDESARAAAAIMAHRCLIADLQPVLEHERTLGLLGDHGA